MKRAILITLLVQSFGWLLVSCQTPAGIVAVVQPAVTATK